ncbi:MAG: 2-C-methyl-D-erythritol 4-phosphate cytidylyltransferase [Dysgonamonadaceae bacterium]|jgi:2-C-methyl-D-erythritol 4-phosphate cytidylyltransferase|nr:2-C-methyl-D-erythritol 4-phosphate cytidylyltransferase [Dysgonamonadaceae bacterium]
MKKYVIILAGGRGLRMETHTPKQFLLLKGKPILMHTIEAFYDYDQEISIILVLSEEYQSYWKGLCRTYHFEIPHQLVPGGSTRFHSVKNALELIDKHSIVAIHDGVRPLVSRDIIDSVYSAVKKGRAVCPVIPVSDSLRIKTKIGTRRVDRNNYYQVQTPQVFASKFLLSAYLQPYSEEFTDDVAVVESSRRCQTIVVDGSPENIKITTPADLVIAEALLDLRCRS